VNAMEKVRKILPWLALALLIPGAYWVLLAAPPTWDMGNVYRIFFIHVPSMWMALLLLTVNFVCAVTYLLKPSWGADALAEATAEVGLAFGSVGVVLGSIWGRPTWGVYWTWDARLTSTAVLLVLYLGYLALRRVPADPEIRARRSAFAALFASIDVPIVHFSVVWWKTLHQGATVLNPDLSPTIHGSMAWTLLLSFVALTLAFVWMLLVRYRVGLMEDWLGSGELDVALLERQAEGGVVGPVTVGGVPDAATGAAPSGAPSPDGERVPEVIR